MTFSILARDPETDAIAAAAATGSLCVGGWVLRGDLSAGLSASQGASPSTFWGENVLAVMREGSDAQSAVEQVTSADAGREHRQLAALDLRGGGGAFTGAMNEDAKGSLVFESGIAAGNMLSNQGVLQAMVTSFTASGKSFEQRLLSSLEAAKEAGGDFRGLLSAALLILRPDRPPLSLRIDHHPDDPVGALRQLYDRATSGAYADWARQVPVSNDRERILD